MSTSADSKSAFKQAQKAGSIDKRMMAGAKQFEFSKLVGGIMANPFTRTTGLNNTNPAPGTTRAGAQSLQR